MKKEEEQLSHLLSEYEIGEVLSIKPFGSGLINHTWKIMTTTGSYIFQRINDAVFKQPGNIDDNICLLSAHLKVHHPAYQFEAPLATIKGSTLLSVQEGYFRLFSFVENSHSIDVVQLPEEAFEAAAAFGKFTRLLRNVDVTKVKITIPDFHNLTLRFQQFSNALTIGNAERIKEAEHMIDKLKRYADIVDEYNKLLHHADWRLRVTHHDTKISNVLFNEEGKAVCVIDLDTIMPGYFISDVGDMMRTYLSPVSEEEKDFARIEVRIPFYKAIVEGYYSEMKEELSAVEKRYFFYAGKFMIYMQALRFLTDHINNDIYYGAAYPGHNYVRAGNQLVLLERLVEKKDLLSSLPG